jgi:zinc protease
VRGNGAYAAVVSEKTFNDAEWKKVVFALVKKRGATVVRYDGDVDKALEGLAAAFPSHACFVAPPEEVTRDFVAQVHRLTRRLDKDPYTDTIWGILTGYTPADALRIASHDKPLVAKRCLTGTVGSPLDEYEEGRMFNELKANVMWEKKAGKEIEQKECPTDTTKMIVDAMNDYKPDVFITSGHATERNWMIGFSYKNGYFKCKDGQLYGHDTKKKRHDVKSPNPKIHMAVGNCLIAHVPDRNCMALALIHSAGVHQMVGYTVPTGYGYGGWGVKDYFSELQAGRFTLAEAHYVNQVALVYNLEKQGKNKEGRFRGGLRGDRDVVVLYGDPAWEARMKPRKLLWEQKLVEKDGVYTFTVTAKDRGDWDNRPVVHLFENRVKDIELIEGKDLEPVIADNFILLKLNKGVLPMKGNRGEKIPIKGDFEKGQIFKVVFRAKPVAREG